MNMPKKQFYFADLFDPFLTVFGVNAGVFATKEKDKERDDASEIRIYTEHPPPKALPYAPIRSQLAGYFLRPGDDATTSLPKASAMEALCD